MVSVLLACLCPCSTSAPARYGGAWERLGLGPFRAGGAIEALPRGGARERRRSDCRAHLAHAAEATRTFRERLEGRGADHYKDTPIGVLNSRAFQTNARGHVQCGDNGTTVSFEPGEGDGSVVYAMSFPPRFTCAAPTIVHESNRDHLGIMSDFAGLGRCLLALQEAAAATAASPRGGEAAAAVAAAAAGVSARLRRSVIDNR